jgi:hypothetical protein
MAGKIYGDNRTYFEVPLHGIFPTVCNESTKFRQLDLLQFSGANPSGSSHTKKYFQSVGPKSDSRQSIIEFHKYNPSLTTEQGPADFRPKTPDDIPHIHIPTPSFRRIQSVQLTYFYSPSVVTPFTQPVHQSVKLLACIREMSGSNPDFGPTTTDLYRSFPK